MRRLTLTLTLSTLLIFSISSYAQTAYPHVVRTFAGSFPLGDGGPATSALLYYPSAVVPDGSGNLYILDSANYQVRKVGVDSKISKVAILPMYGYDMKRASDGSLFVSGVAAVVKISPTGVVTPIAGTGTYGFGGDGGPATSAQIGDAYGVAVDKTGNVFFSDVSTISNRIREVTPDGQIRTVAGGANYGYSGDNSAASAALFDTPTGVAVDSAGAVYVADYYNSRVRRFTVGGTVTTFAGNGRVGTPLSGPAGATPMGLPTGLFIDSRDNVFFTDTFFSSVMRVSPTGALLVVAGNFSSYTPIEDGIAVNSALRFPQNASADAAGTVYIAEQTHRIRQVSQDGRLTTIAGRLHFAGDNGPAAAAFLNEPTDIGFDSTGNAYVVDSSNYLVRKITPAGIISTYAGKANPAVPVNGTAVGNAQFPYLRFIAFDSRGALYLAGNYQIFRVADGAVTTYAGNGNTGSAGDGGKATAATFNGIAGIAVDTAGNLYVADSNRVRVIAADTGVISAFAGNGTRGRSGDGSLATGAQFSLSSRAYLAFDRSGNLYIADGGNYSVRMVDTRGIITTVLGNGAFGHFDGAPTTGPFSVPGAIAFDTAGNMVVASQTYPELYRVSGGVARRIVGSGENPPTDGAAALSSYFYTYGMKIDANNDIYSVDLTTSTVRKLVVNSPTALAIVDGNGQSAAVSQPLAKLLKVQVNGRAGVGVSGVTVNFEVKSGSARLSAASSQTDPSGFAAIGVTLGSAAGPVTITATAAGTTLAAVEFTATATPPVSFCSVPVPAVVSARSAGDFGGSSTFASGSWLEIKGSNLSGNTRSWAGSDFNGANAPTTLDNVTVTINNRPAFVGYISPTQINIQAPADTATGPLDLVVQYSGCPSEPFRVQKAAVAGGLLAPGVFNVGNTQYAAALFQDGVTFVGQPGLIAGVPFRAAKPGDIITLYGIGFGDVSPNISPGTIVSAANSIPGLTLSFGTTPATVSYAGLAPNAVGLYQFNVVVPDVSGDQQIVVKVNGEATQQTAYLTVVR
jgi:uncharacterized protein (TIGR03437 family)